jgi:methenyltetrahydrofolate cyclohydrolase
MSLSQLPFTDLLRAFRSSDPTPGGGSASALAGAVGAALLAMVANLPKPRVENDEQARRLAAAGIRAGGLSDRLTTLMDRDSEAYDLVMAAFRLPRASDAEKQARASRVQDALRAATEAPLEVMRACAEAMQLAGDVAAFGNRHASSDIQVALELLGAGLRGAKLNVDINLTSVTDEGFAAAVRGEAGQLTVEGERRAASAAAQLPED